MTDTESLADQLDAWYVTDDSSLDSQIDFHSLVDKVSALEQKCREAEERYESILMDKARGDAYKAVFMQELAKLAREGSADYAKKVLRRADKAALAVKRSDLVTVQLNSGQKTEQEKGDE